MRAVLLGGTLAISSFAAFIACSSNDGRANGFETTDSGPEEAEASLPPPGVEPAADAGASDADASEPDVHIDAAMPTVECDGGPCAIRLAAGDRHLCALMSDGTVRCWGDNTKGSVGIALTNADGGADLDGSTPDASAPDASELRPGIAPRTIDGISDAIQISTGDDVTCALTDAGAAKCWGANDVGQLGISSTTPKADNQAHPIPGQVDIVEPIKRLDVGHGSVCGELADGGWACWGANTFRQLLTGSTAPFGGPARANLGALSFARTTSGNATIYGLTSEGRLFSWGLVTGRDSSYNIDPAPKENPNVDEVIEVAAGPVQDTTSKATFHTCVLTSQARVYCWGTRSTNELPALCTGVPNDQRVPTAAPVQPVEKGTAYAQQLAVGRLSTCVRLTDGSVQCCGDDTRGQMGTGTIAVPPAVLSFAPAKALQGHALQVATARFATCALMLDGSVSCWGGNKYGELGQGTVDNDPHPVPVKVQF